MYLSPSYRRVNFARNFSGVETPLRGGDAGAGRHLLLPAFGSTDDRTLAFELMSEQESLGHISDVAEAGRLIVAAVAVSEKGVCSHVNIIL